MLVRRLRPFVVASDEVGRKAQPVVRVRLAVRHLRVDPRHGALAFREVAEEKFVFPLVVVRGFLERNAVLRIVRKAHAEAIRLHALVAVAVLLVRIARLDAGKKSAFGLAIHDVGTDALLQLMALRLAELDAADRLAVYAVRLASDGVADARRRH